MAQTLEFIMARAVATRTAQQGVAAEWQWDEMAPADWDEMINDVRALDAADEGAETEMLHQRGVLDSKLDDLHRRTMQALAMLRVRLRDNPAPRQSIEELSARGDSRSAILDEALELEKAWQEVDAAWNPTPNNTLAAFQTLRGECVGAQDAYVAKRRAFRSAAEATQARAALLDDKCIAWYRVATSVFPEGTPQGDMIRSTVPTVNNSAPPTTPTPPPTPPTP